MTPSKHHAAVVAACGVVVALDTPFAIDANAKSECREIIDWVVPLFAPSVVLIVILLGVSTHRRLI